MIQELLSQIEPAFTGEELFDHLNDLLYFIKNAKGQYLVVNNTFMQRCGLHSKEQLIGKTAGEVYRSPMGNSFEAQDRDVLKTGRPLISQLELHIYATGDIGWCLTTKLPLRDRNGQILGLVGVSQDLRLPQYDAEEYQHVAQAVAYAEANLSSSPSVDDLAETAGMSRYQLDRRMRRVFGLTTGQWLLKLKMDHAQQMLRDSELPIAAIAMDSGYSDQSAFTRQFHRTTGMSPGDYRRSRRLANQTE